MPFLSVIRIDEGLLSTVALSFPIPGKSLEPRELSLTVIKAIPSPSVSRNETDRSATFRVSAGSTVISEKVISLPERTSSKAFLKSSGGMSRKENSRLPVFNLSPKYLSEELLHKITTPSLSAARIGTLTAFKTGASSLYSTKDILNSLNLWLYIIDSAG